MAINKDKNSYTIIFSIAMVFVVGSILAFLAMVLKPAIDANKKTEKQQNILFAMGIADEEDPNEFVAAENAQGLFDKYVGDEQYIITKSSAEKTTEAFKIDIKKEADKAKDASYERRLPLFIGKDDSGKKFYIVPMRGNGLWDAIWGYVALNDDLKTVKGVFFDHKGETPGLGANIKEMYFMEDFSGESLYDGNQFKGIDVAKGNNDPKNNDKMDNEVDAIAGATITGNGVTMMIKKDIALYLPYFNTLNK